MYVFTPGIAKTGALSVKALPAGQNCEVEMFLGVDEHTPVVSTGKMAFVSSGDFQVVQFNIIMPAAYGVYNGFIDVYMGGVKIAGFVAIDQILIPQASFGGVTW